MRRRRRVVTRIVPLLIALLGAVVWQFSPLPAIQAVASLSDPARLQTLGERGANPRLNKIVYWLAEGEERWMSPETTINLAQIWNGDDGEHGALVRESLLRNLGIAEELGLLTEANRRSLRSGNAATVTRGPAAGEKVEIDHIVPLSLAPEGGNELANLEMLPQSANRRKSDKVGERQLSFAQRLHNVGVLTDESLERVRAKVSR